MAYLDFSSLITVTRIHGMAQSRIAGWVGAQGNAAMSPVSAWTNIEKFLVRVSERDFLDRKAYEVES